MRAFGNRIREAVRALRGNEHRYGDDKTIHRTGEVNVELHEGQVVAVWFRCRTLPFTQHDTDAVRAVEMGRVYTTHPGTSIKAVVFDE